VVKSDNATEPYQHRAAHAVHLPPLRYSEHGHVARADLVSHFLTVKGCYHRFLNPYFFRS
jgi:hypothetical protein